MSSTLVSTGPSINITPKKPKGKATLLTIPKGANVWLSLTTIATIPSPTEVREFEGKQIFTPLGDDEHALGRILASSLRRVVFESPIFDRTKPIGRSLAKRFIGELKKATPGVRKLIGSETPYFAILQMCQYLDAWSDDIRSTLQPRSTLVEYGLLPSLDGTPFTSTNARKELIRLASMAICIDQMFTAASFWSRKETSFRDLAKLSKSYDDDVTRLRAQSNMVYQLPRDNFPRGSAAFAAVDCLDWRKNMQGLLKEIKIDTPVPQDAEISQIALIAAMGSIIGDQQERRGATVGSVNRLMFNVVTACGRSRVCPISIFLMFVGSFENRVIYRKMILSLLQDLETCGHSYSEVQLVPSARVRGVSPRFLMTHSK